KEARADEDRPSLIAVRTLIGYGSPNKEGTADVHGAPLGEEELALAKKHLDWPEDVSFYVPDGVYGHMRDALLEKGRTAQDEWESRLEAYRNTHPEKSARFDAWRRGALDGGWDDAVPKFDVGSSMATRAAGGKVLNAIAPFVPNLIGGSADLTPSNKTDIKGRGDFQKNSPSGGYIRFGVREHAMAAACNGIALHGGLRPYCGTFLIFSDYMRPSVRLSALMRLPVVYVFTHDSIGLGEDGPTHQPIEQLMSLRAIPHLTTIRPADAAETAEAWKLAVERTDGPIAMALTRQGVPTLEGTGVGLRRGAYVVRECAGTPEIILIGTGSEVQHVAAVAERLQADGVRARAVSMPSWELFDEQSEAYREEVLPRSVTRRLAVEAGVAKGWERYVGLDGVVVGLDRFGASAPVEVVMEKFGFTVENVIERARQLLAE
ncbi:MAG: transketolase, partial [Rhodothermales bacterium]